MKKLFLLLTLLCLSAAISTSNAADTSTLPMCIPSGTSTGTPNGIFPGRVVWSHDPMTVSADEAATDWYDDKFISQSRCDDMLRALLAELTGTTSDKEAWMKLIAYNNGGASYKAGQKIAVKVNNNNTYSHADSEEINASPQLVLALLRSLINGAGISQECIAIAEPSRFITDAIYSKCHSEFPDVRYIDNCGGNGREKVEFTSDAMHYSAANGPLATGIATCFTESDYTINLALLKGHVGQGVTLCAKNWYGVLSLHADWRKNYHNNFDQSRDGTPKYMTFVDFMGHKDLGGKCILYLIDGLLGARNVSGAPGPKWQMAPFCGNWPCTLIGSQDPVAIDMVGLDLLSREFRDAPDMPYADMYLLEASKADAAPSGTLYDPEDDGTPLPSLGLAEHSDGLLPHAPFLNYSAIDLHYVSPTDKQFPTY